MNKLISSLAVAALCALLASCSVLNNGIQLLQKPFSSARPSAENVESGKPDTKPESTQIEATKTEKPVKPVKTEKPEKPVKIEKPSANSKFAGKLDGEWYILKAGNYEITSEDSPYVYFEEASDRFYASDGCNIINGDFTISGEDKVSFDNTLSTMKSCPGILYSSSITKALGGSNPVKIELQDIGQETMMTMKSSAGATLMTLCRHNLAPLNGQWFVKQIGEQKIDDENINLFLDLSEMTTHGNTGCNFFNGSIIVNPRTTNSISFAQMGTTMRLCPDNDVEMAMMVALEQTTSYHIDGNKLRLLDNDGTTLMTLHRN